MEMAKRVGPPRVPPVVVGDLRFEVVHWGRERGLGQNGGYIAAHDRESGRRYRVELVSRTVTQA